jgi:hypothetical protein
MLFHTYLAMPDLQQLIEMRLSELKELSLFDSSVWIGEPQGFPLAVCRTLEEGVRELTTFSIGQFLLSNWTGAAVSPQEGNNRLLQAEPGLPEGCYTIWTGLPLFPENTGPLPGVGSLSPRTAGVRLFPTFHNFPLVKWVAGSLAEWCSQHGLPLFFFHTEIDWKELYLFAADFPDLSIIVETQTEKILYQFRTLCSLMGERSNIYVETSNLTGPGYIEYMVKEFGPERLLFGTFYPVNDPYTAIGMLLDAAIDTEAKKRIAGGTLREMLSRRIGD